MAMESNTTIIDLPLALIEDILLRLPVKSLALLKCICKLLLSLISDPSFTKLHFQLAAAPTRRCLFIQRFSSIALSLDLDGLFHYGCDPVKFSLPCEDPASTYILNSCRGFILLDNYPHLIIWNPLIGARKRISYSHVITTSDTQKLIDSVHLFGFGYDLSNDDYVVVVAWTDKRMKQDHFEFFSVRNNSWKNFEVALPYPLQTISCSSALFLNGAFHWFPSPSYSSNSIIVFDLKERSFSKILLPKDWVLPWVCSLIELEGCLAFYDSIKHGLWVMQEYKVPSSWKLYGMLDEFRNPLRLSNGWDVGLHMMGSRISVLKFDVRGQKLAHYICHYSMHFDGTMFTESLMSLPNDSGGQETRHANNFLSSFAPFCFPVILITL